MAFLYSVNRYVLWFDGTEVKNLISFFFSFLLFLGVNVQAGHDSVATYSHKLQKKAYDNIIAPPAI